MIVFISSLYVQEGKTIHPFFLFGDYQKLNPPDSDMCVYLTYLTPFAFHFHTILSSSLNTTCSTVASAIFSLFFPTAPKQPFSSRS